MTEVTRKYKHRSEVDANFDKTPIVEGKVVEFRHLPEDQDKRRFVVLDTPDALVRVYETKGLEEAFNAAEIGDYMRIEFIEKVAIKGSKTFNRFNASVWV